MKPHLPFSRISRRVLLATAAAAPAFAELVVDTAANAQSSGEILPSWNDGAAKRSIIEFVRITTSKGSPNFLPPEERIAEFDQDGTLWVEHPLYTQIVYCLDRVPVLARERPDLKDREPFKAILSGNRDAIAQLSMKELFEIVLATQSGMTIEEFRDDVKKWLAAAKHPRWNRPYTELVYQPMLEVLRYLRANGYKTFIATGGSASFVREYSDKVYAIPPEHVAGTEQSFKYGYDKDRRPVLTKEAKLVLDNLGAGKIENFWLLYGRRPYAAFGNSSSDDQQMLEYVKAGAGARLCGLVVHDDPVGEYAYGPALGLPDTKIGTLSQAMYDIGKQQGWTIISMKNDWKRIFSF
jgi:phosphoserine phosphatase